MVKRFNIRSDSLARFCCGLRGDCGCRRRLELEWVRREQQQRFQFLAFAFLNQEIVAYAGQIDRFA